MAEFVEYIFAFLTFSSALAQHSVSEPHSPSALHSPSGQFSAEFVEHFLAQNITKQGCGCHGLDGHAAGDHGECVQTITYNMNKALLVVPVMRKTFWAFEYMFNILKKCNFQVKNS